MRYLSLLPLIVPAALAVAGCGDQGEDTAKVYRHSLDQAPTTLDPAHAATTYASFLVVNAYDTLYSYKYLARPYELTPNLAEGMPEVSADGLVYTIPIQQDVHFIDDPAFPDGEGREVTASDVVYSLKRHFDPETRSRGRWLWQDRIRGLDDWHNQGADYEQEVPGLRAVDRYTVRVELTEPYPQFTHTLATAFAAVVPHEAVRHHGRGLATHPVGSGPFRVTEFDSTHATLEPNPDWRWQPVDLDAAGFNPETHEGYGLENIDGRRPPFVDRMRVDFVGESGARWNSFTKDD
jgi:ABC-type oligopeptide transport system substrate-binding subunit